MKIFHGIAIAALIASGATPVVAQEAPVKSYSPDAGPVMTTSTPTSTGRCYGTLCSGDTETVSVYAGIVRAGTAAAMFDAGENGIGESGASSTGEDSVNLGLYVNTCAEDCGSNRLEGTMTANQHNQSYAWAVSDRPGQNTVATTIGISGMTFDFGAGVDACPQGCPAPTGN